MQLTGGCLCGSIRFTAIGPPGHPHSCSCHMCQRHSGAPAMVWVTYPKEAVLWNGAGGEPTLWRSSEKSSRAFCPQCGSTLGAVDDGPTIGLVTGSFDRPNLKVLAPVSHSYRGSRPRWWSCLFDQTA
ncbi:GFA family protein [Tabrizicola sp. J26]|uniref:GFA family protein n=1 Tax=Alitabrizicola rongguiensis TaxID=2909234 RepID=UPI001F2789F6|nr:GFA family protein [Tabrizicola rongguiensis]MCF1708011.1 GFA family protein [Tabrizicola rongguiensis]